MKIVTWNINGIRTFKGGIKKALESLDADIICLQETKVTRDLLNEKTAIIEGYNSFFSFSRGRSGYSGVATFCRDSATPVAAEEGLTGLLTSHDGAVGCYGDQNDFEDEELQSLDNEGRAVITQHKVRCEDREETLTVVNVYCPRADPEKPERRIFKLRFCKLLQIRTEALLGAGSHVIVLGDINTSHKQIDHCDPDEIDNFEENPGRKWLNSFLVGESEEEEEEKDDKEDEDEEYRLESQMAGRKFVDMFRYFHPTREGAFTCWSTLTGARQTNYGTRIDYIFADQALAKTQFLETDIMPEVEGSDHCPVWAHLSCALLPSPRCPPLCTRYMPEFAGRQQKLSRFLVKVDQQTPSDSKDPLPGSQESREICENIKPIEGTPSCAKRKAGAPELHGTKGKKSKMSNSSLNPQGSLLAFFKPRSNPADPLCSAASEKNEDSAPTLVTVDKPQPITDRPASIQGVGSTSGREAASRVRGSGQKEDSNSGEAGAQASHGFWRTVLRGPPQPPVCKAHEEPCVLRTVKKAGPNLGRQFFVCARPQGHASNPEARCNFFAWVDKGK
ncbi:DNA-(apurinic or apyrimidinic site) endonuclease 2 [Paramormyrops kingsleyae]|uniref:DNA-(apurinic or apyrimidinic site) endonuclease n=1 Tax=Paramormyrops kingsleyae TaxID=1676925 RepID=A0A3B3S1D8_9TELE|nr:DNA-(apurinic or apyrimidinic site) lyase 2 [Paramormyrops kingsleyae]